MADPTSTLVSPEILGQVHSLDVAARMVVDGIHVGVHRSPFKGHSTDFADHRPYVPGDDLRHLDWKVLGRRDRLVLKRYEAETDLGCTLVVDGSGSMGYSGERAAMSKYRYASIFAASVAYLVLDQQDRVGLQLFHETALVEQRPQRQGQLDRVCHALEHHEPAEPTDAPKGIERLAAPDYRRGLVLLFTDAMIDLDEFADVLDRLRHRGHDVAVVWILDPDELDLGVGSVSRFEALEGDEEIVAEPRALRDAYRDVVEQHRIGMEQAALARGVTVIETDTATPPAVPINRLLVALQHQVR